MLICKDISWTPKELKSSSKPVLTNISFELEQGNHLLVLGASGCGKTSLMNILTGILTPDSGEVLFNQTSLHKLKEEKKDSFRGQNIGFIFQNFHLIKEFSVKDNLEIAAEFAGIKISKTEIRELLESLNLSDKIKTKVEKLSIGQMQRLAVARALINKPKWIFADEPTSALDDQHCHELISLLESQAQKYNSSLIIVTHDQRVKSHFSNQKIITL